MKKKINRPYTINAAPVVAKPLFGMDAWITRAIYHANGALWNNGTWVVRDVRGKPGIVSNHAKGVAADLSYRHLPKMRGIVEGRKYSLPFIIKCLENADTLGIELVIDYWLNRSWRCDRGTWIAGTFEKGDWYHIEVNPIICNSVKLANEAWNKVFGAIPAVVKNPV